MSKQEETMTSAQRAVIMGLVALAFLVVLPAATFAQTGTIAGAVKDATGGVLPGVTVEASSPALIERVRGVVTDSQGEYKIIDLRPGTYVVTFTLTGFTTVRREGIELTSGTTANVTAEMRVGSIEETITVSGQSSLVDVQSANQYRALTRDTLTDIPTGRAWFDYVVLVPGVSNQTRGQDVGGSTGDQSQAFSIHGSIGQEMPHWLDGMRSGNVFGTGGGTNGPYTVNNAIVQEISIDTSGPSAESEVSGIRSNIVPKQGGNRFSGAFFVNGTNKSLLSNNLDGSLIARGAKTPTIVERMYDVNPGLGGPLMKDRLWFYGGYRDIGDTQQPPGAFYATDPYAVHFTPDLARGPAENPEWTHQGNIRLTWQASPKNKFVLYADKSERCIPCAIGLSSAVSFESSTQLTTPINELFQFSWTSVLSNRLLIEFGETYKPDSWGFHRQPGVVNDALSPVVDSVLGVQYRGPTTAETQQTSHQENGQFKVSYVTGSHNLKIGTQWLTGNRRREFQTPNNSYYTFAGGVPTFVTTLATPYSAWEDLKLNLGVFAQEQWTRRRVTMNAGLRYDHINLFIPAQQLGAVQYVPARTFQEIDNVPAFNDIDPRLGVAFDLFGTGKTALKGSFSRYVEGLATGFAEAVNPITQNASTTRSWTDSNGNFIPDCNLSNQVGNGECGAGNNQNFGKPVIPFTYDPSVATGWRHRGYNWEVSGGVQHALRPGTSVEVSYFHRWFGNLRVTDNTAVTPGDFDPYCIAAPVNPGLPTSGQQICGFYNLKPTVAFGVNTNVVTAASDFGGITEHFDGVDVSLNARLPGQVQVQGGTSTGRTHLSFCSVVGNPALTASGGTYSEWTNPYPSGMLIPASAAFCDTRPPFLTQVKLIAVYLLPWWGVRASWAYQSLPGPQILATWSAPSSAVTGLGGPLAGGARTVSVPLVPAGTMYGQRLNQLDFRVAKNIKVKQVRIQPQIDLYNMLNANPVYGQNNAYGPAWLTPTQILVGRIVKFGVQADF